MVLIDTNNVSATKKEHITTHHKLVHYKRARERERNSKSTRPEKKKTPPLCPLKRLYLSSAHNMKPSPPSPTTPTPTTHTKQQTQNEQDENNPNEMPQVVPH